MRFQETSSRLFSPKNRPGSKTLSKHAPARKMKDLTDTSITPSAMSKPTLVTIFARRLSTYPTDQTASIPKIETRLFSRTCPGHVREGSHKGAEWAFNSIACHSPSVPAGPSYICPSCTVLGIVDIGGVIRFSILTQPVVVSCGCYAVIGTHRLSRFSFRLLEIFLFAPRAFTSAVLFPTVLPHTEYIGL